MKQRNVTLKGFTQRTPTPVGTAFITVSGDRNGPRECFINVGKAGTDIQADAEAIGRLISLVLRLPDGLTSEERIKAIIEQLEDIGGGRQGYEDAKSLPDGIARTLRGIVWQENDGSATNVEKSVMISVSTS